MDIEIVIKVEVKLNVNKFTPNGDVGIGFNQPLNVPFNFVEN